MKQTELSSFTVNGQAKFIADSLNGGYLDFMTGEKPDSRDDAGSDDMRLSRHSFSAVAFAEPLDGELRANAISKAVATRKGEPTWCRCLTKDLKLVMKGTAGQAEANAITKVETIVEGQIVSVTEFKHVVSKQGN